MPGAPLLVVITGPSGVGKDTVLAELKRARNPAYGFPVNVTTRKRRPSESEGVDYFFVDEEEFSRRLDEGDFLEHAVVYGQHKGVLKEQVRQILGSGRCALIRTDIQGARYIKGIIPEAVTIFLSAPTAEQMEERMLSRGGDSPEQVAVRLQTAEEELAAAEEFDYSVVNDDLARCAEEIESIIGSERSRPGRRAPVI
jgi:guanylate kinase